MKPADARSRHRTQNWAALAALLWGISCALVPLCTGHDHGAAVAMAATPAEPVAVRSAALTKQQATSKLSKRCRTLLKVKRPSKLRAADRKRRTTCLRQRERLINESKQAGPGTLPGATTPVVAGPRPTDTAPPSSDPTPTPAPPTTPEELTNEQRCTDGNPATKCFAAVGVTGVDGDVRFGVTRGEVTADIVNFELQNADRQSHDLWIAPANAEGTVITGQPVAVTGMVAPDGRASRDVALAPGVYVLICSVSGHDGMLRKFVVRAPAP